MQLELTFQRAVVHPVHDTKRLEAGQDLNDALLDFFVKLGQAVIPEGRAAPVAYLGSHFFDVLRKGGVKDGREGHKNVANWARRRLGKEGLFGRGIGALAVPVNEHLQHATYDGRTEQSQEKHWWLALLLNPAAICGERAGEDKDVSMLCLDSFVRAEQRFVPPVRATKNGSATGYPVEVMGLSRIGFNMKVHFKALGDGTAGPLPEPHKSRLRAGGRAFANTEAELKARDQGGAGRPGRLEGALSFRLDRRGAAKTVGQYNLEFGEQADDYEPALKLRMGEKPTWCQAQVAQFIGGYLDRERELTSPGAAAAAGRAAKENGKVCVGSRRVEGAICLPGVPQQETSHDCGFFIMEMILRTMQLAPEALRELATASSVEIAMLPWPSQQQILRRKAMLKEIVEKLFAAARRHGTGDVEALIKAQPELKGEIRAALMDGGPSFTHGFDRWAAGDWDLSPSPSRSQSRGRKGKSATTKRGSKTRSGSGSSGKSRKKKRKKRGRSSSSDDDEDRGRDKEKRRRRKRSQSSSEEDESRSDSKSKAETKPAAPRTFSKQDLETMTTGELRKLCVLRGVLPAGAVERSDLSDALAPLASEPPPGAARAPAKAPAPAVAPPAASSRFKRSDLEAMSTKELKALCTQKGVLPPPPLEKTDLVQALAPFAVPG